MQQIDERIAKLESLDSDVSRPDDFIAFWQRNLQLVRETPIEVGGGRIEHPFDSVGIEVRDITISGIDGTPIRTWFLLPAAAKHGPVPLIITYHGAGGQRNPADSHAPWLLMGYAVLACDFRLQGGLTGSHTAFDGGLERWAMGCTDKNHFYFRYLICDALRMVEFALQHSELIDSERIGVTGISQGGAACLAVAALHDAPVACAAEVPGQCDLLETLYRQGKGQALRVKMLRNHPELLPAICETLPYFDLLNLVSDIRCPVQVSVGLEDPVCVPEGVYKMFKRITAPKTMIPYPFADHVSSCAINKRRRLAFFQEYFASSAG